ncbi:hypothetical protein EDC04DRAFT_2599551 [Pisolithus marmoratus]|nr:hypothetical protein EDC04DRAFT_2599551 [Pisolithus marmoratus]
MYSALTIIRELAPGDPNKSPYVRGAFLVYWDPNRLGTCRPPRPEYDAPPPQSEFDIGVFDCLGCRRKIPPRDPEHRKSDLHLGYRDQASVPGAEGKYSNEFVWAIQLLDPRRPVNLAIVRRWNCGTDASAEQQVDLLNCFMERSFPAICSTPDSKTCLMADVGRKKGYLKDLLSTNCGAYQIPLSLFRSGKDLVDPDSLPQQVKYNMVASSTDYAEKTKNQINPSWKKRSS